jgi:hypothetical protein
VDGGDEGEVVPLKKSALSPWTSLPLLVAITACAPSTPSPSGSEAHSKDERGVIVEPVRVSPFTDDDAGEGPGRTEIYVILSIKNLSDSPVTFDSIRVAFYAYKDEVVSRSLCRLETQGQLKCFFSASELNERLTDDDIAVLGLYFLIEERVDFKSGETTRTYAKKKRPVPTSVKVPRAFEIEPGSMLEVRVRSANSSFADIPKLESFAGKPPGKRYVQVAMVRNQKVVYGPFSIAIK